MKKLLAILPFLFLVSCDRSATSVNGLMERMELKVYVCTGPMSECYHCHSDCYGLENCSASVRAVSLQEARQMGRRPCRLCY